MPVHRLKHSGTNDGNKGMLSLWMAQSCSHPEREAGREKRERETVKEKHRWWDWERRRCNIKQIHFKVQHTRADHKKPSLSCLCEKEQYGWQRALSWASRGLKGIGQQRIYLFFGRWGRGWWVLNEQNPGWENSYRMEDRLTNKPFRLKYWPTHQAFFLPIPLHLRCKTWGIN